MYGHVNNVVYYAWFDSVITEYLIREGGLDIQSPDSVALYAVETACRFHRSLAFPETIDAGLRVGHLGNTSARFEVALFRQTRRKGCRHWVFHGCLRRSGEQQADADSRPDTGEPAVPARLNGSAYRVWLRSLWLKPGSSASNSRVKPITLNNSPISEGLRSFCTWAAARR